MKKRCMTCGEESDHGFCEKHRDPSSFPTDPPPEERRYNPRRSTAHGCVKRYDNHGGIRVASSQVPTSMTRRQTWAGVPIGKTSDGKVIREVGKGLKTVDGAKVIENHDQRVRWNAWEQKHE
jgi:hypothetical protein